MAIARAKTRAIQNPAYRPAGTALRTPGEFETKKAGVLHASAPDFTQIEHVPENLLGDLTDQMNRFDRDGGAIQPSLPAACASKV
jgi:hypothetical protein